MEIPIPAKDGPYIETGPCFPSWHKDVTRPFAIMQTQEQICDCVSYLLLTFLLHFPLNNSYFLIPSGYCLGIRWRLPILPLPAIRNFDHFILQIICFLPSRLIERNARSCQLIVWFCYPYKNILSPCLSDTIIFNVACCKIVCSISTISTATKFVISCCRVKATHVATTPVTVRHECQCTPPQLAARVCHTTGEVKSSRDLPVFLCLLGLFTGTAKLGAACVL